MQTFNLQQLVIIDIETVPCQPTYDFLEEGWQSLWDDKIKKIIPEGMGPAIFYDQRAGVMAEFSKIICISLGYFTLKPILTFTIKSFYGDDEKNILMAFIGFLNEHDEIIKGWGFAGHNIKEFDVPFICRRLLINGLLIPAYLDFQNRKPWETNLLDTFQYWRFGDYKNYTSLNLLAKCLSIPSPKEDMDGSMVAAVYYQERNLPRIVSYCQQDILTVANIVLRFMHKDLLTAAQIKYIQ